MGGLPFLHCPSEPSQCHGKAVIGISLQNVESCLSVSLPHLGKCKSEDIGKGRGSTPCIRWGRRRFFVLDKSPPLRRRQNCIGICVLFQTEPPLFVGGFTGTPKPSQHAGVFEFGKTSPNTSLTDTCFAGDGFLGGVKSAGCVVEAIKNQDVENC